MVYVGKKGGEAHESGTPPEDEVRIPQRYSGNAFGADGTRRSFTADDEALRHAEELFRRGYVFEDEGMLHSKEIPSRYDVAADTAMSNGMRPDGIAGNGEIPVTSASVDRQVAPSDNVRQAEGKEASAGDPARDVPTGKKAESNRARPVAARPISGLLGGIFDKISTEEILLAAIILILFLNGTDDELLIMLVILLFC